MSQPTLAELQFWMKWIISHPAGVNQALNESNCLSRDQLRFQPNIYAWDQRFVEPNPRCLSYVGDDEKFKSFERLNVYAEAYFSRLSEALADDYRAIRELIGDENFLVLVVDYLMENPSSDFDLSVIGRTFAEFLSRHDIAKQLPWIVDLAELEWNVVESFYSTPLEEPNVQADLAPEDAANCALSMDSSLRILSLSWNVDEIWQADDPKLVEIKNENSHVVIHSQKGDVSMTRITHAEYLALGLAIQGNALNVICQQCQNLGGFDHEMFGLWSVRGWFRGFSK